MITKCSGKGLATCLSAELLERMASVLRVLAHPHRLKIVEFLERSGSAPVSLVQTSLSLPQSATSQHLGMMKRVGLLASSRQGKEIWYRIADPRALTILDCIRKKSGVKA